MQKNVEQTTAVAERAGSIRITGAGYTVSAATAVVGVYTDLPFAVVFVCIVGTNFAYVDYFNDRLVAAFFDFFT